MACAYCRESGHNSSTCTRVGQNPPSGYLRGFDTSGSMSRDSINVCTDAMINGQLQDTHVLGEPIAELMARVEAASNQIIESMDRLTFTPPDLEHTCGVVTQAEFLEQCRHLLDNPAEMWNDATEFNDPTCCSTCSAIIFLRPDLTEDGSPVGTNLEATLQAEYDFTLNSMNTVSIRYIGADTIRRRRRDARERYERLLVLWSD